MIVKGLGFGVRLTLLEKDILSGYGETACYGKGACGRHYVDIAT